VQDGLLDVVVIRDASVVSVPLMTARLFSGSLRESPNVHMHQGREVIIRRDGDSPVHVDGEPQAMPPELRIVIRPRSLRVLVPAGARI
jgi:diacylglycerol kinase family enzyme